MGEARALRVRYTPNAALELDKALTKISKKSPQGANNVKARIKAVIALLPEQPFAGRLTSKSGLRRVVAYPYPHLVFYRVLGDEIIIVGIRHGARGLRQCPPPPTPRKPPPPPAAS